MNDDNNTPTTMPPGAREYMSAIARLGGRKTSARKTAAARRNAKRGGWPKGRPRKPAAPEPATN